MKRANASHPEKKAVVVYDTDSVTLEQMRHTLLRVGYVAFFGSHEGDDTQEPASDKEIEFQSDDLVCFCFGYTRNDIDQDYIKNGQSAIMAKIASEKKTGGCDCTNKNPKGR